MNPYQFIASLVAVCLTAGFLFTSDASIPAKVFVSGLLVLSFFVQGHSLFWDMAGAVLQALLSVGLLIYFRVAR
ncbi:MAG: hypothetical protein ABI132_08075 [Rhodanobacteraceae bacterium]